jgi:hypothetical protein
MLAFRRRPFRCRFCECRFYRPSDEDKWHDKVERLEKQPRAQAGRSR